MIGSRTSLALSCPLWPLIVYWRSRSSPKSSEITSQGKLWRQEIRNTIFRLALSLIGWSRTYILESPGTTQLISIDVIKYCYRHLMFNNLVLFQLCAKPRCLITLESRPTLASTCPINVSTAPEWVFMTPEWSSLILGSTAQAGASTSLCWAFSSPEWAYDSRLSLDDSVVSLF